MEWKQRQWSGADTAANDSSTDTLERRLQGKVQSICFMQDRKQSKQALDSLVCMMKDGDAPLSEFYAKKLLSNYNGDEADKDTFLEANAQLEQKANKRMRIASEFDRLYSSIQSENQEKLLRLQDEIKRTEAQLKKAKKSRMLTEERIEALDRLRRVYLPDKSTNSKKRKLLTENTANPAATTYTPDSYECATELIMESIGYFLTDEWRYIALMLAASNLKHPLAVCISVLSGWAKVACLQGGHRSHALLELEAYVKQTKNPELALIAKHHIAADKCSGTDEERREGLAMLNEAAASGFTLSMVWLSSSKVCKSIDERRHWAQRALDAGDPAGGMCLALTYHDENLSPLKEDEALRKRTKAWMTTSAQADVTRAQYWLGRYTDLETELSSIKDVPTLHERYRVSAKLYEMAAEKGHSGAMFEHGKKYIIFSRDAVQAGDDENASLLLQKGLVWLEKAETRGNAYAKEFLSKNVRTYVRSRETGV